MLRLVTVWPFPEQRIRELAGNINAFVVPEINLGQVVLEVERCAGGKAETHLVGNAGGHVILPTEILDAIKSAASGARQETREPVHAD
jgi:2-oxoglutarate/2-oxoacid ferredoxin oxidoreductase subunit alpha